MTNILDNIVEHKKQEVAQNKVDYPVACLEKSIYMDRNTLSLSEYLLHEGNSGIIAEFKRKSPSKGMINEGAQVGEITSGYVKAGASALSVLTDNKFFGGENKDLTMARETSDCPVLRKDFIIDEYQILEAKAIGADAILLIAAVLSSKEIKQLAAFARSLGLEVLMEVHEKDELKKICEHLNVIGVNNRNLKDFSVDIEQSVILSGSIPAEFVRISESGLSDPHNIITLQKAGFQGFLIGETFMKTDNPAKACAAFIRQLENIKKDN
jgi:indole-3-glycerol phosphate synthase